MAGQNSYLRYTQLVIRNYKRSVCSCTLEKAVENTSTTALILCNGLRAENRCLQNSNQ